MKYLIDESLSPKVARSLAIVGHVAESVQGQFGKGVKDAEIIRWCRDNEYVFVHADDRLRRTLGHNCCNLMLQSFWCIEAVAV
ncbi:MAG: hypothetical protein F4Y80_02050 [Caldilineaceae bacterium SB0665_bin_21]|nr:hypothetical protein [Caldilineaceae bacterium SB0665_bin_21]